MPFDEESGPVEAASSDLEALRAGYYALLGRVLAEPPAPAFLLTLQQLRGGDGPLGAALDAIALAAKRDPELLEDEYTRLFYGMGQGGELLPYASYYLTGSLHDRPLASLRTDMERLGISRSRDSTEPEDHIALELEMMHGLIAGSFGAGAADLAEQTRFYDTHLAPWAETFFRDLETAQSADFYVAVARLGQAFLQIESQAFQLAA